MRLNCHKINIKQTICTIEYEDKVYKIIKRKYKILLGRVLCSLYETVALYFS